MLEQQSNFNFNVLYKRKRIAKGIKIEEQAVYFLKQKLF